MACWLRWVTLATGKPRFGIRGAVLTAVRVAAGPGPRMPAYLLRGLRGPRAGAQPGKQRPPPPRPAPRQRAPDIPRELDKTARGMTRGSLGHSICGTSAPIPPSRGYLGSSVCEASPRTPVPAPRPQYSLFSLATTMSTSTKVTDRSQCIYKLCL